MVPEPTPKDRCTSLDLRAVVREAQALVGARLEKAFDLTPSGLGLLFRRRPSAKVELRLVSGRYAALVGAGQEHAEGLSPLAHEVRRLATGASVTQIPEPAGERYLELFLSRPSDDQSVVLAAELFGTGNLLVARGGRIAAVEHPRRWAGREVRPGAEYVRPPARADAFAKTPAEIEGELARSRSDLASTLAVRLALGGPLAEEVIARGGLDPAAAASPQAHELAPVVHEVLRALLAEVGELPRGYLVVQAGTVVDATPYRSRRWEGVKGVEWAERPTFSEAAVAFFDSLIRPVASPEDAERAGALAALERLRSRQSKALADLSASVAKLKGDADAVFGHYAEVEAALAAAAAAQAGPQTVRVELGGRPVELAWAGTARAAAQALYEESKRLTLKLEGVRAALRETESRLASEAPRAPAPVTARPGTSRLHKPRWFEKYRWFVSSEGAIVLGGRDAASNDLLVRRHLKEGDLYLHADLHGAASVVVKRPTPPAAVSDVTIREAAQWAVAFSKAWRAGLASATAFWASPDQVSKSAGSGEFVPRGAWVVRGTKHYVADVPLELAVGPVRFDGDEYLLVAPPAAVAARGAVRFLLTPGEERTRAAAEVELARELDVPRSRLQALLPAGGLSVRRP